MNRTKKHLVHTLLVILILLIALFILGDTSFEQVTRSIPQVSQTAAVADFNSSLVAHYTFDDTASDSAGSNNGTLVGGPTYVSGKIGKALQFDGVDDKVTAPLTTSELTTGMTVSLWIKNNLAGSGQQILLTNSGAGNYSFAYQFGNRLAFTKDGSTDLAARTSSNFGELPVGAWVHLVMAWDGSPTASNVSFYRNGVLIGHDINTDGVSLGAGAAPLTIGVSVNGTLDDVRIYNKALSTDEVAQLYALGGGTVAESPTPPINPPPVNPPVIPPVEPPPSASPSTVSAATCGDADVQAAIDAVADGGVVLIPAGTCTWRVGVNIGPYGALVKPKKSLVLKGAGIDKTIIIEDLTPSESSLTVNVGAGKAVRVTEFTFEGSKTRDNKASLLVTSPPQPSFRIDHMKFNNVTERGVMVNGGYGLIDHNTFIRHPSANFAPTLISVIGDSDASWSRPQDMGTANAVYIEDNILVHNIQQNGPFDMYRGARYVFRHNKVYGNGMGHHGFDSDTRGEVNFEVYDNYITNASPTGEPFIHGMVFEFRSGSGVIFNNTVKRGPVMGNNGGYYDLFGAFRNYRSSEGSVIHYGYTFPWDGKNPWNGICDGTSPFDGNISGMHGYPCKDQIGRTSGFGSDGKQTFSPIYVWNNSFESGASGPAVEGKFVVGAYAPFGCPKGTTLVSKIENPSSGNPYSWVCTGPNGGPNQTLYDRSSEHIVEGRDFYNGTPRPGYTPYTYPHPLTLSGFTSDAGGPVISIPVGVAAPQLPQPVITPPPVTPPVIPPVVPPVTPPPLVPPVTVLPPVTLPPTTPAVPSIISRILPSFTSPTRTPTTPSNVTKPKTPPGPFVPLPEATPEDVASSTERTSFTATIKDIFSYILSRISNGFKRVFKSTSLIPHTNQTAAVADFNSSLVAHYTFDEGSVTSAPVGNAKSFNGTSDKVVVSDDVVSINTVTICAWIYPTAINGPHAIVSNSRFTFGTYLTNGRLHLTSTQNNGLFSTDNAIGTNRWYHVCGIRTAGSNGVGSIYINGEFNSSGNTGTPVSGYGLALGNDQSNSYPWSGNLDDLRIYNRALTAEEISQLYQLGASSVVDVPPSSQQSPPPNSSPPSPGVTQPDNGVSNTQSLANTTTASSCSAIDVQYAIDHTLTGGTIFVPAGDCSYTAQVRIPDSKRVRIIGGGIGVTTLRRSSYGTIFSLGKSGSRVSGFTFVLGHQDANAVQVDGTGWRIDHNRFQSVGAYPSAIWVREETPGIRAYGVTDHNDFADVIGVLVAPGNIMNNISWFEDLELGTERATYIEDSTFTYTRFAEANDSNYGARLVFRHNTVKDTIIGVHSVQGLSHRATRSWEFYDNTFINTSSNDNNFVFQIRGGTGVIFNNTIIGKWRNPIIFDNVRDFDSRFSSATKCGGASPWDGNQPIEVGGQGTHTGLNTTTILADSSQQWPVNGFVAYTAGEGTWNTHWVWNLTDGSKGLITTNTANTITATLSGGTRNTWNAGDSYKISNGYPCRDQIGRSKDQWLWTSASPYPPQQLEPVYLWNNKMGGTDAKVSASQTHIKSGRDYVIGTPRPGYTPYTYPHPLTRSGFTSDDPNSTYTPPPVTPAPLTPQVPLPLAPTIPPVIPPVVPPVVIPPPVVTPPATVLPPVTLPPTTSTPNFISRILPSFTSPTRTPTTPSNVTKLKTPPGPFVPLPEATPEDIASSTERTSFTATIKDILSYILSRIERGIQRVVGR